MSQIVRDSSLCQRTCQLNEQAFSKLTPEAAYWVGFLMADGSIVGRSVGIALALKDAGHLELFRAFMGSKVATQLRQYDQGVAIQAHGFPLSPQQ